MTARRRLLAATWALSALLPLATAAAVYATSPRARVHPVDHAVWAVAVASSLWCAVLSTWLVLRLSRAHAAIVAAAGRVAAGDAAGRVVGLSASGRVDELGRAVNAAIAALDRLATSQRHFVTHAAHGLRRPVQGLLDELVPLSRGEAEGADAHVRVWESAQRVALLAEDLLALERIGVGLRDPAVLSLREVASAALELVRAEARARGVALGVDGDGRARGRASDLQRLVRHLLENAVRHSPSGAPVRVIIRDDPPFVTLRVRDQGGGVPSADRHRVFEPFARVGGGSGGDDPGGGMGLAIVREIARAHGGDVSLDPADPARRGATFTVRLPRV